MKMMTQCHGSLVKERHLETVNGNCSVSVSCHTLGKWNLILNITCHHLLRGFEIFSNEFFSGISSSIQGRTRQQAL